MFNNVMKQDLILSEKLRRVKRNNMEFGVEDTETIHAVMDQLIVEELESLGYKESAAIFRGQEKYYA